jgi:uncharacterized protein YecA (UPF0149 family)
MGLFDRVVNSVKKKQEVVPEVLPGRNDLCWCGSGKKYKKCHLPEVEKKSAEKACSLNCGST